MVNDVKASKPTNKQDDKSIDTKHLLALEEDQLAVLQTMNSELKRLSSYRYTFLRGIVRGVGTAVGATIIAAVVFWILSQLIDTVDQLPIISDLVENFKELEELRDSFQQNQ